jgi:hypothetical protein
MRAGNHVGIERGSARNWWSLAGMIMRDQRVWREGKRRLHTAALSYLYHTGFLV